MKNVQYDADRIRDELHDACRYIKLAISNKHDNQQWADRLYQMASQEYQHAMFWHDHAVYDIDEIKKKSPAVSTDLAKVMQDKWDEEHEHYMEKAAKFKALIDLYKETQ